MYEEKKAVIKQIEEAIRKYQEDSVTGIFRRDRLKEAVEMVDKEIAMYKVSKEEAEKTLKEVNKILEGNKKRIRELRKDLEELS